MLKIQKVGIIANATKDIDLFTTRQLIAFAQEKGCQVYVSKETMKALGGYEGVLCSKNVYKDVDCLVVLGGDGTILRAANDAALFQTPLLGINLGKLGYLTDVEKNQGQEALELLLLGRFSIETRMMLEVEVPCQKKVRPFLALNDVCVTRGRDLRLVEVEVAINNEYFDTYRADGLIVCTPTGSTAYNLSAGGPILKPDANMICITPICPHTLSARSTVISSKDVVCIRIKCKENNSLTLSLDGQRAIKLTNETEVFIKASQYQTRILKTNTLGFYDLLRLKMMDNII